MSAKKPRTAAIPTIKRLPLYLRSLRDLQMQGEVFASSAALAKKLMFDPVVVRKDLAITGVVGTPRLGFPVDELISAIVDFLGWQNTTDALLCGVGSLGRALLGYSGFDQYGLRIVAAFDINPQLIGSSERGVNVFDMAKLPTLVARMQVQIGILTVPAEAAQSVADTMIAAGVCGIWNFTPVKLEVPDNVVIQRVDLAASLAVLSHRLAVQGV